MTAAQGFVYLVGAGPGDPKLLTLRALELIRSAEVVAYDELVSPEILSLVPAHAELLAVGRRHGHGKTGYQLHPVVIERARAGRIVVRLKSGDPLIFGRGAEEAEELAEAGIPFEIVPGISAALGAAAYAGIPLTDRRYASRVTLATGHRAEANGGSSRETLVLYMAAHRLKENLERLIAEGHAPSTPAAYVAAATTPRQIVISGTLADLAERIDPGRWSDPALVIVGEVVALRDRIRWFEKMPLRGRRVLVARAQPRLSKIAAQLRVLGAHVIESPKVSVDEPNGHAPLDQELRQRGPDSQAGMEAPGATVEAAPAYRYSYESTELWGELPELILLPNSTAARLLLTGTGGPSLAAIPMLAIGPKTEAAARLHGASNVLCWPANSIESAVSNTIEALRRLGFSNRDVQERGKGVPAWER